MIDVWESRFGDWAVIGETLVKFERPSGYDFYMWGDVVTAKAAKRLCEEAGVDCYRVRTRGRGYASIVGYYFPEALAEQAMEIVANKRGDLEA